MRRLTRFARDMRRRPTREEGILWRWLRDRRFGTLKFRRQHPIGGYIADFYCVELKLAIELDGKGHEVFAQDMHDINRDCDLPKIGVTVVRLTNEKVRRTPDDAAETIRGAIEKLRPSPGLRPPSPASGRGL